MRPSPRFIFLLGALSAFGPLTTDVYLPGLPDLARDLGVTNASAQVTFTMCVIGIAAGQIVAGPVSDAVGRRRPLLVGLLLFTAASMGCALAGSIAILDVLRFVQGFAGATGITLARAMVRDSYDGLAAGRVFSTLGAIVGATPVLAPALGSLCLFLGDWRVIFWLLAAVALVLFVATTLATHETLPPERRRSGGLPDALRTYRALLADRRYTLYALPGGAASILLFGYISSSSFVYQDHFGFSPQVFGVLFGLNGALLTVVNMGNRRLIGRVSQPRLLEIGMVWLLIGGVSVALAAYGHAGRGVILPLVGLTFSGFGLVFANAMALALEHQQHRAGAAAGLMGLLQFAAGGAVSPIVGAIGATPQHMGLIMAVGGVLPLVLYKLIGARRATLATPR